MQPTASIENRSNHCYANATLQAMHWLCSFLPARRYGTLPCEQACSE